MDIARINLAHLKTQEEGTELYNNLKIAFKNKGKECPICVDLRGPAIRFTNFPNNLPIELKAGTEIYITVNRHVKTSKNIIFCDSPTLPFGIKPGDRIIADYGKVSLTVKNIGKEAEILASIGAISPIRVYQVFYEKRILIGKKYDKSVIKF